MIKAFVSWSGGKDASFSFHKAAQNQDVEIAYLLNMVSEDGKRSRTHGVSSELLKAQAKAIAIPIIQRRAAWETYEEEFKKAVLELKEKGVNAGIFGDIDFQVHRDWVERVCKECNIKPLFPLWQRERSEILGEFIDSGFEAVVVAAKSDVLGLSWVGRRIDEKFVEEMERLNNIDLCGEAGEYHTFVFDGPIFKKKIKILKTEKIQRDKSWFLDILDYEIADSI
ncbi:MAG: diphthine--ammonia ligase [Candidatus Omnitrophica bacterium]|nr:diphthine--ammonia ligase [Candidatus Omnitrophota bacterium]